MQVVVTGIGVVSALGLTLKDSWTHLRAGESGIVVQQSFPELSPRPLGLVGAEPSTVTDLLQPAVLAALEQAQLEALPFQSGVVIGSSRGFQAQWETEIWQRLQSQTAPLESHFWPLYNQSPAVWVAQKWGVGGPVLAPRAACATGLWAIAQGADLIRTGQCQQVLVGAVEAPVTPLTLAGFAKMGALATTGAYPFDRDREGFVLGEGAAVLMLELRSHALARGVQPLADIRGYGFTADGYHCSAPDEGRGVAISAIQNSLHRSGLSADQVDFIHAHGTATRLNDQAEATIIEHLFPHRPAVTSTKGATGHTLGASGALGVAFSCMALQEQVVPPCTGLMHPEFALNLRGDLRSHPLRHSLCLSFGFGGQNAALIVSSQ